jgi:hypothetical protein
LWYSFVLLGRRVSDGVRGSVCDHVGYKSGTVLVYSYALTGPAALYAPEFFSAPTRGETWPDRTIIACSIPGARAPFWVAVARAVGAQALRYRRVGDAGTACATGAHEVHGAKMAGNRSRSWPGPAAPRALRPHLAGQGSAGAGGCKGWVKPGG